MEQQDKLVELIASACDRRGVSDSKFPDNRGEYWALCPFHADTNPTSFSFSERGFKCLACGAQGGLKALAAKLNVDVPKDPPPSCTLADYAAAKHLTVAYLRGLGVTEHVYNGRTEIRIPYMDQDDKVLRVKRRLALGKTKGLRFSWVKTQDPAMYLYGLWKLAEFRLGGWVILVEGESDCHTAWLHGLPVLGVPGSNTWSSEWAPLLAGMQVYAWMEADQGGRAFVERIARDLPGLMVLRSPDPMLKDLSDLHVAGLDVVAAVEEAKSTCVSASSVLSQVEQEMLVAALKGVTQLTDFKLRWSAMLKDKDLGDWRDQVDAIASTLSAWLLANERLLVDVGQDASQGGRPYAVGEDNSIFPIEADCVPLEIMMYATGLNPKERAYAAVLKALQLTAHTQGRKITLARWQYSPPSPFGTPAIVYVSSGPTRMVKATVGGLELVPNGTDNVWFAAESCYPAWEPAPKVCPLAVSAFKCVLQAPSEVPSYDEEVQRALLLSWIGCYISGLRPTPALVAIGDKGGGKSTVVRAIVQMFMGAGANLTSITDDRKDFDTLVTTMPLLALDNVDGMVEKWVPDKIASVVTGMDVEMRALYTNAQRITRPVTALLAITTRTGAFMRADIAERCLPLSTGVFTDEARLSDDEMRREVQENRNGLLSWAALTACEMLTHRHEAPAGLPLRFTDFANMTWAYCRSLRRHEWGATLVLALRHAQTLAMGENDPITEAMMGYFDVMEPTGYWKGSATELIRDLVAAGAEIPFFGGGKAVARHIREAQAPLSQAGFSMWISKDGSNTVFTIIHDTGGAPTGKLPDTPPPRPLVPNDKNAVATKDLMDF